MKRKPTSKKTSGKANSLQDSQQAITRLTESATRGELAVVIGSGVSMALTNGTMPALSWKGLVKDGFTYGVKKGRITKEQEKAWESQLDSSDIDDLLCAAEFVTRKLDAPKGVLYARWIENALKNAKPENMKMASALDKLAKAKVPICTLNYDRLLEVVTRAEGITLDDTAKVTSWMRRETSGILHLHGSSEFPVTCVLGVRSYETTLGNEVRELIQRSLASFRRLLFIGCGDTFADPNFCALIKWLREKMNTAALEHYALVSDGEVAARHADPAWHGFVEPVGYGAKHADLPGFLLKHFVIAKTSGRNGRPAFGKKPDTSVKQAKIISDYLSFLLKDCGQMTIEGVRADMDIGQRKFDIERLFVPLKVLPCPPDIPDSDPRREEKLRAWHEKNKEPLPFGKVFGKHTRLALLALPGGGKTLLLKRLAVAYADPVRRVSSEDALPELDVTPVLIRCREWREHIHNPILTILQKLPEITGDNRLAGLSDALLPLFKKGSILLLVDGLDEIHNDAHRATFVEHLEAFLDEYKSTRLIVTSREAGFGLVAPCIARFCDRWRVAPLEENAITALCDHWQGLMAGDSPQALLEGREVAQYLLRNASLRRLAENPLLLTMLLVVKHGAGRLPPDRVGLYGRAVDILLDTWNIKGHDPLNPKEAVPQLACIAFEMMRAGKQTATEKELLNLLEEARDKVPQIRRYAKDSPHEFLKRVELRSSLLLEAGHKVEAGHAVPFYQFRHLTFQEYLSAVAAAEGHYMEYDKNDSVLTPLAEHLTTAEWKEVIPMSAVLARKQAEPLMAALVKEANQLRAKVECGEALERQEDWIGPHGPRRVPAVSRLVQCLVEEAEAAPETLTEALRLTVFFGSGCSSEEDWVALARGPYGNELLHQAWLLYSPMRWPEEIDLLSAYAHLTSFRKSMQSWVSCEGRLELMKFLGSENPEEVVCGLFTCAGLMWHRSGDRSNPSLETGAELMRKIESHLLSDNSAIHMATAYTLAYIWHYRKHKQEFELLPSTLNRLLFLRLHSTHAASAKWSCMAIAEQGGLPRNAWKPVLTDADAVRIREASDNQKKGERNNYAILGDLVVAFHSGTVWSEAELVKRLRVARTFPEFRYGKKERTAPINCMLKQMGETRLKYLKSRTALGNEINRANNQGLNCE